ncbi:zona pellucida glycoprotein 3f, tandem duplicate 2 [Osmerus eperlanus]|uniref:zona pellucida glycoprotein 3f, tandem duplicate 2 n=1 Tax=Osmerus eperlanus TaxID=29151 RepID=UPI002E15FB5D
MVSFLKQGVIIFAVIATFVNTDIDVDCGKDYVTVKWRVHPDLVSNAARLFLGNCLPSQFIVLPTGGEAIFIYSLNDCKFKRLLTGNRVIYTNQLTYRPYGKPEPAVFTYQIKCVYNGSEELDPRFLQSAYGSVKGNGELVFHMGLLNENLTAMARTNVILRGSFIPIWAAVEQGDHQPLLLLMDECVAALTAELQPETQVYPIITNHGCLVDGKAERSKFLSRYHSSAIVLYLNSFKFDMGQEVYIHCNLVAWDPEELNESRKACHYVEENEQWELLDDVLQSSLCNCCDSKCSSRLKRGVPSEPQGLVQNSVIGPLIIVEN